MLPVPLDEYPVHQVPLSMRDVATSDRNAYDRCYFNAHDRTGEIFLVTGMGVYPNLGVTDAYATVRRGDMQTTVRMSDALDVDRMRQQVGPYRVEVIEPLERIRLVCDADDLGIGFDLTWTGSFPAAEETPHVMRSAGRVIIEAQRFWQVGTWAGVLRVDGEEREVTDDRWLGSRDRSWGIRPVGEAEPPGRAAAEPTEGAGFWWTYVPLRFDDFGLMVIAQEDGDGTRTLSEATRVWPASSGRPPEQLGDPQIEIRYRRGTRVPESAVVSIPVRGSAPLVVEVACLNHVGLNCGPGYGGDPDWSHGQWKGRGWVDGVTYDMTDAANAGRSQFSVIDHAARARCGGAEGWGLFEHGCFGRHAPTGFSDWSSVAP